MSSDSDELNIEIAWIFTNLALGDSVTVTQLVKRGVLDALFHQIFL
jgi:hypothetical protein